MYDLDKIKTEDARKFLEHEFDFSDQHKDTYDNYLNALREAVKRRHKPDCFIGVSSGYDSGTLSHMMTDMGLDYKAYSLTNGENNQIIKQRGRYIDNHQVHSLYKDEFYDHKEFLRENLDNERYTIKYNGKRTTQTILDDKASAGVSFMCKAGKEEGRDVYLSTQGADEIICDYAKFTSQSELEGRFPKNLKEWYNFKWGCNYSYIMKEERVPELYGIETRFPFLDINVVQEFLWLTPELKNRCYKAPLEHYLTKFNIPFEKGAKRGFNPL